MASESVAGVHIDAAVRMLGRTLCALRLGVLDRSSFDRLLDAGSVDDVGGTLNAWWRGLPVADRVLIEVHRIGDATPKTTALPRLSY